MTYLSSMHTPAYQPAMAMGGLEQISQYHGNISALETAVHEYAPIQINHHSPAHSWSPAQPASYRVDAQYREDTRDYTTSSAGYLLHPAREYFSPIMFLKDNRPSSLFIGKGDDIKHYILDAFEATMGKQLPEDIVISVVTKDELHRKHQEFGGEASDGLQGFAINRKGVSHSMIFVRENELDQLLLTIGHEIGHCMSRTLPSKLDEEAKAFAFELAWMDALVKHDIARMGAAIDLDPRPANNGLHNVAFNFVKRLARQGKNAMHIFHDLITRTMTVGEEHVR